jgi:hypothetical protein
MGRALSLLLGSVRLGLLLAASTTFAQTLTNAQKTAYSNCVLGANGTNEYHATTKAGLDSDCPDRFSTTSVSCSKAKTTNTCIKDVLTNVASCGSDCPVAATDEATVSLGDPEGTAGGAGKLYSCYAATIKEACGDENDDDGGSDDGGDDDGRGDDGSDDGSGTDDGGSDDSDSDGTDGLPTPSTERPTYDSVSGATDQQGEYDAWTARGNSNSRRTLFNDSRVATRIGRDTSNSSTGDGVSKPPLEGVGCGPTGKDNSTAVTTAIGSTNPYSYPNFLGGKTLHVAAIYYSDPEVPAWTPNEAVVPHAQIDKEERTRVKLRLFCGGYKKVYLGGDSDPRVLKDVTNTIYETSNTVDCGTSGITAFVTVEFWGASSVGVPSFLELRALPNDTNASGLICKHKVYLVKDQTQYEQFINPLKPDDDDSE